MFRLLGSGNTRVLSRLLSVFVDKFLGLCSGLLYFFSGLLCNSCEIKYLSVFSYRSQKLRAKNNISSKACCKIHD